MTLSTRLRRMEARLTAREHAVVLLRRWKEGSPVDLELLDLPGVPAAHRSECLPMVQRFLFTFEIFTNWQGHLQGSIELARARLAHLETILAWEAYAEELGVLENGVASPPAPRRATGPGDRLPEPPIAHRLAESLRAELADSIASCWREIRACNEALEKLSADYGEDAAHPMLRESIEVQKDDVMALRNDLAALGTAVELPEPLAADREYFDLELRALP